MKSDLAIIKVSKPFSQTLQLLRDGISSAGMLLICEINTQEILGKHGIEIAGFRQLLFFRPDYMQRLLSLEPHAAFEVPLKIIVRELADNESEFWFKKVSMTGCPGMESLSEELKQKVKSITDILVD